jgi:hypothetical protein
MLRPCLSSVLALALLAPARARASEPSVDTIALLPVTIDGELSPAWRERLQASLREGFARGRRALVDIDAPAQCDAVCLRQRSVGARWIARARVTVRDRDFDVAIELLDARDGTRVTSSARTCEVCAVAEVGEMLADHAGVLDRKLDTLAHAAPSVRFETRPTAATVWLDGALVGTAPIARTVAEGRHRARAEQRGYLPVEMQFDAVAGTRESVLLELSPDPRPPRAMRAAGWTLLAVGLAGVAAGVPLVVLHGRPYRQRCTGNDVDADGDCRFRYGTRDGGATALAVGSAALVSSIVLLATSRARARGRVALRGPAIAF